jgi:hypothetical protein
MRRHLNAVLLLALPTVACAGDAFVTTAAPSAGAGGAATSSGASSTATGMGGSSSGTGGASTGGGGMASGGGGAGGAGGAPLIELEKLTIPSDGTMVSSKSYPSGSSFQIQALGSYKWGGCDPVSCPDGAACSYDRLADAGFESDDCWVTPAASASFGLRLNGNAAFNAAGYRANHDYTIEAPGADAPFTFHIADFSCCYGDNVGDLEVRILGVVP